MDLHKHPPDNVLGVATFGAGESSLEVVKGVASEDIEPGFSDQTRDGEMQRVSSFAY